MRIQELVAWRRIDTLPDADETVLVILDDGRQRWSWVAVWDGNHWRDACGMQRLRAGLVINWSPMPRGPM